MRIRTQVTHLQILKHTVAHCFQKGWLIPGFWDISIYWNHYYLKCNKSKIKISPQLQHPVLATPISPEANRTVIHRPRVSLAGVLFALREPPLISLTTTAPEDTQLELSASRGWIPAKHFAHTLILLYIPNGGFSQRHSVKVMTVIRQVRLLILEFKWTFRDLLNYAFVFPNSLPISFQQEDICVLVPFDFEREKDLVVFYLYSAQTVTEGDQVLTTDITIPIYFFILLLSFMLQQLWTEGIS